MDKQFYTSKRFWAGLAALIAGIGLIATGEEGIADALPEIIITVIGLVQTILGMTSTGNVAVGSKVLGKKD